MPASLHGLLRVFRCSTVRAALAPSLHRTAAPSAALTGELRKR
ncbi:MAG: hypothetical protein WBZ29_03530 [Methanocella sp.]